MSDETQHEDERDAKIREQEQTIGQLVSRVGELEAELRQRPTVEAGPFDREHVLAKVEAEPARPTLFDHLLGREKSVERTLEAARDTRMVAEAISRELGAVASQGTPGWDLFNQEKSRADGAAKNEAKAGLELQAIRNAMARIRPDFIVGVSGKPEPQPPPPSPAPAEPAGGNRVVSVRVGG